jgi:hypothetical protein
MNIPLDLYYWKAEVDGEEWIIDGSTVEDVTQKILQEEPNAEITSLERTNIIKVLCG